MKILVIDDSKVHLQAAIQTLGQSHELTTCSSYDEAVKLLESHWDSEVKPPIPYWDVVLCDLLMPAGKTNQGEGLKYAGQEMPVGWALALSAAQNGAQYVAVVTDIDHHSHPASALLDFQHTGSCLQIHNAKAIFINSPRLVGIKGSEYACDKKFWQRGLGTRSDGIAFKEIGKDWWDVLTRLLAGKK